MQNYYLPRQIACQIIELEVGLQDEQGVTKESILDLIQAYTKAVQFYNERNDEKRNLYYQRKMQDLMQRQAIIQVLYRGQKSELTLRKQKTQQQVRKISNQTQQIAKKLIKDSSEQSQKQQQFILKNLAQQQQSLQQRIQRKRANSSRFNRPKFTSASFTCGMDKKQDNLLMDKQKFIDLPIETRKK